MTSGPLLGDGDLTTGYENPVSDPPTVACDTVLASSYLTGAWVPGGTHNVTALSTRVLATAALGTGGLCSQCPLDLDPGDPPWANITTLTYAIEAYSGGAWGAPFASGTLTNGVATTITLSFAPFNCEAIRVVVFAYREVGGENTCSAYATARVNEITVTSTNVTPCTSPSIPTGLAVGAACSVDGTTLPLTWNASTGDPTITYQVQNVTNGAFYETTSTGLTATGLTPGTLYTFRIRATNDCGTSAWSGTVTGTPLKVPDAPTPTGVWSCCVDHLITWPAVPLATSYSLYVLLSGTYTLLTTTIDLSYTRPDIPDSEALGGSSYRLIATNACGNSANADFTIDPLYTVSTDPVCDLTESVDPVTTYEESCQ